LIEKVSTAKEMICSSVGVIFVINEKIGYGIMENISERR